MLNNVSGMKKSYLKAARDGSWPTSRSIGNGTFALSPLVLDNLCKLGLRRDIDRTSGHPPRFAPALSKCRNLIALSGSLGELRCSVFLVLLTRQYPSCNFQWALLDVVKRVRMANGHGRPLVRLDRLQGNASFMLAMNNSVADSCLE